MSLFIAEGLFKHFGGLIAVDRVSLTVEPGEIHALIGPNGAGKTTLVNVISGLLPLDAGRIILDGVDLTALPPHQRVRHGLSRSFQITRVFNNDSVLDNLLLAVQAQTGSSFRIFGRRADKSGLRERAIELAQQVGLGEALDRIARALPHGAQRQLDVALALAAQPKLLLLDEPLAGMGPEDVAEMVALIQRLCAETAILLIEHDMDAVFQLADRISVLDYGRVLTSGDVAYIRDHPEVQAVYLGTEAAR
ncbi:MAG: branched-chain amino acid transport system ATP-binding protein [Pseudomonadota bacterium]|nr:branched-chain amino acid transport system ATP-binding protein [Pseudomonadota bacterium]